MVAAPTKFHYDDSMRVFIAFAYITFPIVTAAKESPRLLFPFAVEEARRQGLEKDPRIIEQIDGLLYQAYIEKTLRESKRDFQPSEDVLRAAYEREPMIRIRYLLLRSEHKTLVEEVKKTLKSGTDFKDLVLKYSQDESAKWAGDLDFRGVNGFPEDIYATAIKLKMKEVSAPMEKEGAFHFIQLLDKKSYTEAPATYVEYLRARIRKENEERFLSETLSRLKKRDSRGD